MGETAATLKIRYTIKKLLKKKKLTYADYAIALGLGEAAVKTMMTKGQLTIDRIEQTADWFGLSLQEFFELAFADDRSNFQLTATQETTLSKNPLAMHLLFLLSVGFHIDDIKEKLAWPDQKWQKALLALDRCELIELHNGDKIRLKHYGPFFWKPNGELEKSIYPEYLKLLTSHLSPSPEAGTLQSTFELYLTDRLAKEMKNEISNLIYRYFHLARIETTGQLSAEKLKPYNAVFFLKQFDGWGPVLQQKARQLKD